MKIDEDKAYGISSFYLTWALMMTLIRNENIKKADLLTSLELLKDGQAAVPPIDELVKMIQELGDLRGN